MLIDRLCSTINSIPIFESEFLDREVREPIPPSNEFETFRRWLEDKADEAELNWPWARSVRFKAVMKRGDAYLIEGALFMSPSQKKHLQLILSGA